MSKHLVLILALLTVHLLQCASDPDDNRCLSQFSKNVEDPNNNLNNWSESVFAKPCNGFTSLLRGATCNNGRIYKLSLQNFSLRGRISPYLSNCSNLQSLDLSSNSFTGEIPKDLKTLVNLAVLNLSSNKLSGNIPPEIADCAYLNIIDLHDNSLSGQIPPQLGTLARLSSFDVSNNQLSGPIPSNLVNRSGNLPMFNASSFIGNKHLCGYPLPPEKTRSLSVMAIVVIGLGSGILSLTLSFTVVCFWLRVTQQRSVEEDDKNAQFTPKY